MMCVLVVSGSGHVAELWDISAVTCGLTVEKASLSVQGQAFLLTLTPGQD